MTQPSPEPSSASAPDHRDVYLLALGLLMGVLLGPAVLGRVSATSYERMFLGGHELTVAIEKFEKEVPGRIASLAGTGVTGVAVEELQGRMQEERLQLEGRRTLARHEHALWLAGRTNALLLAVAALMVLEGVLDPAAGAMWRRLRQRAASARYALLAIWLALLLAQPEILRQTPPAFVILLLVVAVAAMLVPMGRRA